MEFAIVYECISSVSQDSLSLSLSLVFVINGTSAIEFGFDPPRCSILMIANLISARSTWRSSIRQDVLFARIIAEPRRACNNLTIQERGNLKFLSAGLAVNG